MLWFQPWCCQLRSIYDAGRCSFTFDRVHGAVKTRYFRFQQVCGYEIFSSLVGILRDSLKRNQSFVLFHTDLDHRLENYDFVLRNFSSRLIKSKSLCYTRIETSRQEDKDVAVVPPNRNKEMIKFSLDFVVVKHSSK